MVFLFINKHEGKTMTTQMMNMMITKMCVSVPLLFSLLVVMVVLMVTITMMLNNEMISMTSKKIFSTRKYWVLAKESESDQDDEILIFDNVRSRKILCTRMTMSISEVKKS